MKKPIALLLSLFYTVTLLPMGFSKIVVLKEPHLQTLKRMACVAAAQGKIDWLETIEQINHTLLTAPDEQGATPLFFASQEGKLEAVQWLIKRAEARSMEHACFLDLKTENEKITITPLHIAAARGHADIIRSLATHWAQSKYYFHIDCYCPPKGRTALHYATAHGHVDAIRALFACGADMHSEDRQGITPLDLAAQHPNRAIFEEFQKQLPLISALQLFDEDDKFSVLLMRIYDGSKAS